MRTSRNRHSASALGSDFDCLRASSSGVTGRQSAPREGRANARRARRKALVFAGIQDSGLLREQWEEHGNKRVLARQACKGCCEDNDPLPPCKAFYRTYEDLCKDTRFIGNL